MLQGCSLLLPLTCVPVEERCPVIRSLLQCVPWGSSCARLSPPPVGCPALNCPGPGREGSGLAWRKRPHYEKQPLASFCRLSLPSLGYVRRLMSLQLVAEEQVRRQVLAGPSTYQHSSDAALSSILSVSGKNHTSTSHVSPDFWGEDPEACRILT